MLLSLGSMEYNKVCSQTRHLSCMKLKANVPSQQLLPPTNMHINLQTNYGNCQVIEFQCPANFTSDEKVSAASTKY